MLRHLDVVPGIASDDPPLRRFLLQRIEIFRFAGEEGNDRTILEQPAGVAFAHEFYQVGAEGDVEDGFRIGLCDSLYHRTGIDLALRRPLLVDPLDIRALLRHQLLEYRNR